jgi:hypothetical protein
MEHDYTSRVALLLDDPNRDTLALCALAQAREKPQPFALM